MARTARIAAAVLQLPGRLGETVRRNDANRSALTGIASVALLVGALLVVGGGRLDTVVLGLAFSAVGLFLFKHLSRSVRWAAAVGTMLESVTVIATTLAIVLLLVHVVPRPNVAALVVAAKAAHAALGPAQKWLDAAALLSLAVLLAFAGFGSTANLLSWRTKTSLVRGAVHKVAMAAFAVSSIALSAPGTTAMEGEALLGESDAPAPPDAVLKAASAPSGPSPPPAVVLATAFTAELATCVVRTTARPRPTVGNRDLISAVYDDRVGPEHTPLVAWSDRRGPSSDEMWLVRDASSAFDERLAHVSPERARSAARRAAKDTADRKIVGEIARYIFSEAAALITLPDRMIGGDSLAGNVLDGAVTDTAHDTFARFVARADDRVGTFVARAEDRFGLDYVDREPDASASNRFQAAIEHDPAFRAFAAAAVRRAMQDPAVRIVRRGGRMHAEANELIQERIGLDEAFKLRNEGLRGLPDGADIGRIRLDERIHDAVDIPRIRL